MELNITAFHVVLGNADDTVSLYPSKLGLPHSLRTPAVVLFVLLLPFIVTYIITRLCWEIALWTKGPSNLPPTIPYTVPLLGNAFYLAWNSRAFINVST